MLSPPERSFKSSKARNHPFIRLRVIYPFPLLPIQQSDSNWTQLDLAPPPYKHLSDWRSVRVADVTYDGVPDLLVVTST